MSSYGHGGYRRAGTVGGLVLASAIALEIGVRLVHPHAPILVVGPGDRPDLTEVDGVPQWSGAMVDEHEGLDCLDNRGPNTKVAVFVGSSVFYVAGTDPYSNFVFLLRDRFEGEDWCFINSGRAGYMGDQALVNAKRLLNEVNPDVIAWEVFKPDGRFLKVGETWYDTTPLSVDDLGFPLINWVPPSFSRWMFQNSEGWRQLAMWASVRRTGGTLKSDALAELVQEAEGRGVQVVMALFPHLNAEFDTWNGAKRQRGWLGYWARDWAAGRPNVHVLDVPQRFQGVPVADVRLDTCCHYNARGHTMLADGFEEIFRKDPVLSPPSIERALTPAEDAPL